MRRGLAVVLGVVAHAALLHCSLITSSDGISDGVLPAADVDATAVDASDGAAVQDPADASCGVAPCGTELVASGQGRVVAIAVDGTSVYWLVGGSPGAVRSCPIAGCVGAPAEIASGQPSPIALAVGTSGVFWTSADGTVQTAPLDGGAPRAIATNQGASAVLAVEGASVYWAKDLDIERCLSVAQCPTAGVTTIVVDQAPRALVVGAGGLYWLSDKTTPPSLVKASLSGSNRFTIAYVDPTARGFTVDTAKAHWTADQKPGAVRSVSNTSNTPDGGALTLASGLDRPAHIGSDGTNVYVLTVGDGSLVRVPVAGGAATVLATGLKEPSGVAVGTGHVWVANAGDGTILRVPK